MTTWGSLRTVPVADLHGVHSDTEVFSTRMLNDSDEVSALGISGCDILIVYASFVTGSRIAIHLVHEVPGVPQGMVYTVYLRHIPHPVQDRDAYKEISCRCLQEMFEGRVHALFAQQGKSAQQYSDAQRTYVAHIQDLIARVVPFIMDKIYEFSFFRV